MKYISMPAGAGDVRLKSLWKRDEWTPHRKVWLQAWADYRAAEGDPWIIEPATFQADIAERQLDLWISRRSNGPIYRIRRDGT